MMLRKHPGLFFFTTRKPKVFKCKYCGKSFEGGYYSGCFCSALCAGLYDIKG
jgi:hypothetical protein